LLLAACGDGGDGSSAQSSPTPIATPPPTPSTSQNGTLQISGAPLTVWLEGRNYSFTPDARDTAAKTLVFSATDLPAWATLDANTGRMSGTPSAGDVGVYANITISASNGVSTVSMAPFSISVVATAPGTATLSWTPPTNRIDGTLLTNLTGYKIYWGVTPGEYPNEATLSNPGLASYVIDQLTPAKWYFAMTAIDSFGNESEHSNEASKTVQ
jgi:hypothetical protein